MALVSTYLILRSFPYISLLIIYFKAQNAAMKTLSEKRFLLSSGLFPGFIVRYLQLQYAFDFPVILFSIKLRFTKW